MTAPAAVPGRSMSVGLPRPTVLESSAVVSMIEARSFVLSVLSSFALSVSG